MVGRPKCALCVFIISPPPPACQAGSAPREIVSIARAVVVLIEQPTPALWADWYYEAFSHGILPHRQANIALRAKMIDLFLGDFIWAHFHGPPLFGLLTPFHMQTIYQFS